MWARFRKILSPPVFPGDEDKTRVADMLNTILLIVLLAVVAYTIPAFINTPSLQRILVELVLILTAVGMLVLMRRGYVRLAAIALPSLLLIIVSLERTCQGDYEVRS